MNREESIQKNWAIAIVIRCRTLSLPTKVGKDLRASWHASPVGASI